MRDFDFDDGLAALAQHAHRTGRLETAASIRSRADRRRRRRYVAAAVAGVVAVVALGAGIALARPDSSPPLPPAVSPSVAPAPTPSTPPSFAPRGSSEAETGLNYKRSYRIIPAADPEPVVGLVPGASGRVEVPTVGAPAMFTISAVNPTPNEIEWLIRLDEEGGSQCLSVQPDRSLGLAKCAPSHPDQRFEFRRGPDFDEGRPTYAIVTRDPDVPGWLTWDPSGTRPELTAEPGPEDIRGWIFNDEGPSTLAD